jgi:anti-sigma B factor antagonist
MKYTIEHNDKIVIFTLKHITLNSEVSAKMKAELLIICQPNIEALILDLTQVEAIDSSGLGALLLAHRQLNEYEIPIFLVGVQPMVMSLINISQIEHLFEYADDVEEALQFMEEEI